MSKRKDVRTRGKLQLSKYFQEFKEGESVAVIIESSVQSRISKKLQGRTGVIEGRRGSAFEVKIKDNNKEKKFIIPAIHLKKIKQIKLNDK
jgi:ribosomal protein L21E